MDSDRLSNVDVEELERILEKQPKNVAAYVLMGNCLEKMGMPQQALEQYRKAAQLAPNDLTTIKAVAKFELSHGQNNAAHVLLTDSLRRYSNDPELIYLFGFYCTNVNELSEAKQLLERAIDMSPHIPGLAAKLAEVYLKLGRYQGAYQTANMAVEFEPQDPQGHMIKGIALSKLGYYSQATRPLSMAYTHMPYNPEVAKQLALSLNWSGSYEIALEPALMYLATEASLGRKIRPPQILLMELLRKIPEKKSRRLIREFSQELEGSTPNAPYRVALGQVVDEIGMHDIAVECYRAALQTQPNNPTALFLLGKDLELIYGKYEDALLCYAKAEQIAPYNTDIADYHLRLQERLAHRQQDIAWQLRDWLTSLVRH